MPILVSFFPSLMLSSASAERSSLRPRGKCLGRLVATSLLSRAAETVFDRLGVRKYVPCWRLCVTAGYRYDIPSHFRGDFALRVVDMEC